MITNYKFSDILKNSQVTYLDLNLLIIFMKIYKIIRFI